MEKYGINNVRGGSFCEIKLNEENTNTIKRMIVGSTDKCYICGKTGHFAYNCKDDICYEDIWICDYCDKEFDNENECKSHENKCKLQFKIDFVNLKKNFILNCKLYDKFNNNIIQGDEIIKVLKKTDKTLDFKLSNIYGICQQINNCKELLPLQSYKDGINYLNFIDWLIYFIKKDALIKNKKQNKSQSKSNNFVCYRCGRPGHKSTECYAKTNLDGDDLDNLSDSDEYEEIEIFCCDYCGKEYESLKGLTCHQNLYCKKTNYNITNKKSNKNCCYRCGRDGHYEDDCYASTHTNGRKLY